mgnify:CR=1 FL=1
MGTIHVSTEHGGILLLTFTGEVADTADIASFKNDIATVAKSVKNLNLTQGNKIKVLIDITNFTATYVSEAVDALVELAREDKELVEKTAVFGGSTKVRVIGDTIIMLSGRKNIKFFENKTEAVEWLNS